MKNLLYVLVLVLMTFTAQAQWVDVSPVAGVAYNTMAVSGSNLFAAAYGSGVYLSTDNGTNWTQVNSGLTDLNVASLLVLGSNLYAGVNGGGVFLSTDNGTSWTPTGALGTNTSQVHNITAFGSKLFAGTLSSGIYVSTDNGTSWTQTSFPIADQVRAIIASGTILFAGTMNGGVYISNDNGINWTQVNSGGLIDLSVTSLSVFGGNLFAGLNGGNSVYVSPDNGTSWKAINSGFAGWGVYVQSIATLGRNNLIAGTFLGGVYLSSNNGASWVAIGTGFEGNPMVGSLLVSSKYIYAGVSPMGAPYNSPGGLWRRPITDLSLPAEFKLTLQANSGSSFMIDGSGILFDCGYNGNGQLGIGNGVNKDSIQQVAFPTGVSSWTELSAGAYQTLAIGNDGNIYGCGYNGNGQLGNGINNGGVGGNYDTLNVKVIKPSGVTSWEAVITGAYHSIGLGNDGNLYTWGWNGSGQLGIGSTTAHNTPQMVAKPTGVSNWVEIAGGSGHTIAIGSDGNIYTWGYNSNGQLGIGSTTQQTLPQLVSKPAGVLSWTSVRAGFNHSLALGNDGNLYAWGANDKGELGIGSKVQQLTPQLVKKPFGITGWTYIAAGGEHSLALCNDGNLYSWGANGSGQLGIGNKVDQDTAVMVPLPTVSTVWTTISAGQSHSLAIGNNSDLFACGSNGTGQLGVHNLADTSKFVKVQIFFPTPVELSTFTALPSENNVILNWATATETNNYGFSIERKSSDGHFGSIGFIKGKGTTTEKNSYSFKDNNLNKGSYIYRLQQIDFDGRVNYSSEVNIEITGPRSFSLSQNYPNPFNPTTDIKYSIPQNGMVTLKIFNLLGQELATLVNMEQKTGSYTVNFNASNLASGVYMYRIQTGNFTLTKKMMIMK